MQLLADFIEQNFSKILRVDAELWRLSLHCSNAYSFKQECFQKVTTYFFNSIALLYCVRIWENWKFAQSHQHHQQQNYPCHHLKQFIKHLQKEKVQHWYTRTWHKMSALNINSDENILKVSTWSSFSLSSASLSAIAFL